MATVKRRMKKIRKNIKSTKTPETNPTEGGPMKNFDTRSNQVFTNIIDLQQRIATNLTARYPFTSKRVNKYLFVI